MLIPLLIWILTIFQNGTSVVSLNTTYSGGFMTIALPTQYQSQPLAYVNNTPVIPLPNGTSLIVPVFGNASVYVIYVPKVSVSNGFITINVINNATLNITIPYNYILIYNITLNLINYTNSDGQLIITARGPGVLSYAVVPATTAVSSHGVTAPPFFLTEFIEILIIIIVVIASVGLLYSYIGRRKAKYVEPTSLSDYEVSIINYLKSVGGEAYEVDISRQLSIPRTTVWRAIKRLEGIGIVEVKKVHGKNLVILKK